MTSKKTIDISYFPGCSLATSAKESNQALFELCKKINVNLIELEDWNCCGSSSAHSIDSELALNLASRNLSLVPDGMPLLAACPSCILRLQQAQIHLETELDSRTEYKRLWGKSYTQDLQIMHFFELFDQTDLAAYSEKQDRALNGLRFVPYYGCMLHRPPSMRHEKNFHGLMEKNLSSLGAEPIQWAYGARCCGTFLSVAKPEVVVPLVNEIAENAIQVGAECLITACAMCHLNLEIRCTLKKQLPIFHFSEIIALALGVNMQKSWFARHLVDPNPLLKTKQLIT